MLATTKTLVMLLSISAWFATRASGGIFTNDQDMEGMLVYSAPVCLSAFGLPVPAFDTGAGPKAETDKPAVVGRPAPPSGRTYYVDGEKGNDQNVGTAPQEAWRSIRRANGTDLAPGDQLLFAGGQAFEGTLRFGRQCGGTKDRPILISSFGQGRAAIKAGAADGLVLTECEYVVIKEVNVLGCGRKNGSNGAGISLTRTRHVSLDAIEVSGFRLWAAWGSALALSFRAGTCVETQDVASLQEETACNVTTKERSQASGFRMTPSSVLAWLHGRSVKLILS